MSPAPGPPPAVLFAAQFAIALILGFYNSGMDRTTTDFLSFISLDDIHVAGIAIVIFISLAFLANILPINAVEDFAHRH